MLDMYLQNLKEEVRLEVRCLQPNSLDRTMELAQCVEVKLKGCARSKNQNRPMF